MTMQETTPTPTAAAPEAALYADLAAAQAEFTPVVFNRVNPAFKSRYADLAAILAATRPALNRHGLFLTQKVRATAGGVEVETILAHKSGQVLSSGVLAIPFDANGRNRAQALGSARTYACRYSLSSFLGVAADDDDDGNACAAPTRQAPPPPPQVTDVLKAGARAAAARGMKVYEEFFKACTVNDRRALKASGLHDQLKAQAAAVKPAAQPEPQAQPAATPAGKEGEYGEFFKAREEAAA